MPSIDVNQLSDSYNLNTEKGIMSLRELLNSQDLEESQGNAMLTMPEQSLLNEQTIPFTLEYHPFYLAKVGRSWYFAFLTSPRVIPSLPAGGAH